MAEELGRPKRKVKRAPTKKPNASHYVGYVDDEETPEMIMKKFEMLDKFLEASSKGLLKEPNAPKAKRSKTKKESDDYAHERRAPLLPSEESEPLGPDQVLNERQLTLLFKMTSSFSVPADGFIESSFDGYYAPEDFELSDEENFFIGEDEFFGGEDKKAKKKSAEPKLRKRREKDTRGVGTYKPKMKLLSMELVGADGMYYTIKKKVKMVDPLQPTYVRIPSQVPLPRSWSRTIAPYTGFNSQALPDGGYTYIETNIVGFDLKSLGRNFQGVIIDPPWLNSDSPFFTSIGASSLPNGGLSSDSSAEEQQDRINMQQLYELRVDEIVKAGLLLIWTEKRHIAGCIGVAGRWGFTYVENVVWVKQQADHTVLDTMGAHFFAASKVSLLIFKKGSNFAMRHQRNPDVIFDYARSSKYLTLDKPKYAYTIAETLLPDACYSEETGHGQFLEIWSRRGSQRKGWTSLVQKIPEMQKMLSTGPESIPLIL